MRYNRINLLNALWLTLLVICPGSNAQMNKDLKHFLWNRDFNTLIQEYAEEKITLVDSGDFKARLDARSFVEEPGMRIQTFAGISFENAAAHAAELEKLALDSVYVLQEDGLSKVQLGNFQDRLEAEKMLDRLRFNGVSNGWIVQTVIHLPKTTVPAPDSARLQTPADRISSVFYGIQLLVSSQWDNANRFAEQFNRHSDILGQVIPAGDNWKVIAGRFSDEALARQKLDELRNSGYPDAWLTQIEE